MNKRFLIGAAGVVVVGVATLLGLWLYSKTKDTGDVTQEDVYRAMLKRQGGKSVQEANQPQFDEKKPVRLAIGSLGLGDDNENRQLGDLVTTDLTGAKEFELVDRQSIDRVLREQEMSLAGLVRAQDAVRVGKLLRADWFLLATTVAVNGTNSMIARVVDARTGIMRDVGVFRVERNWPALASGLAAFVRQCRQTSAGRKQQTYLAIGTFEDLSVNNRLADLPTQLRAHLTQGYQGSKVTLLERELARALLNEVRLDLAGLTQDTGTNQLVRMQSAFWLVSGSFQSYETTNLAVELTLDINHFFGRVQHTSFREQATETLLPKVKETIDKAISENRYFLAPTKRGEIMAQLDLAKDFVPSGVFDLRWAPPFENLSPTEAARQRRNREEAVQALETVLLLDPSNHEAKMYLAAYLRRFPFDRVEEARDYYRQIIEDPVVDRWTSQAQQALIYSFPSRDPVGFSKWFETAAGQTTNSVAGAFYSQHANAIQTQLALRDQDSPKAREAGKQQLIAGVAEWENLLRTPGFTYPAVSGLDTYLKSFGTNRIAAAIGLSDLLPGLQKDHPEIAPHLLAAVAACQVDTNAPVVAEFKSSFLEYSAHPEKLSHSQAYFAMVSGPVLTWAVEHTNYDLCLRLLQATETAAAKGFAKRLVTEQRMGLAFAYAATERWQHALDTFLMYSNRPTRMGYSGLWGDVFTIVFPSREVARCRKKLGLPEQPDPREFDFGKPCLCLHGPNEYRVEMVGPCTFTTDQDGLWICNENKLICVDFGLQTNLVVDLPDGVDSAGTCLSVTPTTVWIGTSTEGLIEFDRATKGLRHYRVPDGLLVDGITSLCATPKELWIGYSQGRLGGLGRMDLGTRKVTSFTSSLATNPGLWENPHGPTRVSITALTAGGPGEIWFLAPYALRRYRQSDNTWESFPLVKECRSLDSDPSFLYVGHQMEGFQLDGAYYGGEMLAQVDLDAKVPAGLGVEILNLETGQWRSLPAPEGLPRANVSTVTVSGKDLWVGGFAYVALVDAESGALRKFAYNNRWKVDRIQVGGGFVWAQFDQHLYRASLASLR